MIKDLSFFDFSKKVGSKARNINMPILAEFELTYQCNLNCLHCYVPKKYRNNYKKHNELNLKEYKLIFDELVKMGCIKIWFIGGEPFMKKDFGDIYKYAYQKGFLIKIYTNGTLLTEDIIDLFKEYPPYHIDLPIYGVKAETHDKVTQVRGSWARLVKNIELLKTIDSCLLTLKTTVNIFNKNEVKDMKLFAEKVGLPFRFDNIIIAGFSHNLTPCKYRVSPEEAVEWEFNDLKFRRSLISKVKNHKMRYNDNGNITCGAGKNMFIIDPYGIMRPCLYLFNPAVSIKGKKIFESWNKVVEKMDKIKYNDSECLNCEISNICPNCLARAKIETGIAAERVGFFCKIANLRKKKLEQIMQTRHEK